MAGADLTTLSNIMKEFYLGPIQDQFNNEVLVTQLLPTDAENLEGLEAVIPLHSGQSGGIGSRPENATLPSAGNQAYEQAKYDLKYHYARIQVSGPAISKTKSDAGAFAQALKEELSRIKTDVMMDFARQLYGDGSAQIASISSGVSNATQTLSSDEALQKGFIYVGMVCDCGTAAAPTNSFSAKTVVDVDVANSQITLDSSVTTTTGHFIFRSGNAYNASTIYEMDAGLQKLIAVTANTVGALNSSSAGHKFWQNIWDTTGGAISLSSLMQMGNKVQAAGGRSDQIAVITTPGLTRRLFETDDFKTNVRFVNSTTLRGGFEALTFTAGAGTYTINSDRLAPYGKVFFVHKPHFRLFSPADWDFLSRDGLTIRWVSDKDAFQAVLFRYANLGTDRRNTSAVMSGLTDTGF